VKRKASATKERKEITTHLLGRDREDLVEFFEGESLGLGHEEPNCDSSDDVPRGVPSESSLRLEGTE
jgi:hypothetical protein